jgi:tellurite resistance protein TehA-like permease
VATQGLAATTADVARHAGSSTLVLIAAVAWLLGFVGYLAGAVLIGSRALGAPVRPDSVAPDSWILMGALAIGALAGARLIIAARALRVGAGFIDAARALTWWAWILAGLWIPVLLYAEIWRADHLPGSLRYRGVWWSAVFPVGMFAAASSSTATVLGTRPLWTVSLVFCWMAVTLWLIVALGMVHSGSARWLRYRRDRHRHGRDQRPERQAPSAR